MGVYRKIRSPGGVYVLHASRRELKGIYSYTGGFAMLFELKYPWIDWSIRTEIGKLAWDAKIDTGAFISLIGVNIAVKLGLSVDFIKNQNCVRYIGAVESSKGYAFKVPCASLPLGDASIPIAEIYIPFTFTEDRTRYRFVSTDRFLIGTDILNNYNLNVVFTDDTTSSSAKSAYLELMPHNIKLPKRRTQDYSLANMSRIVDEIQDHDDNSFSEEVTGA